MTKVLTETEIKLGKNTLHKTAQRDLGFETVEVDFDRTTDYNGNTQLSTPVSSKLFLGAAVNFKSIDGDSGGSLHKYYLGPCFENQNGYYASVGVVTTREGVRNKRVIGSAVIFLR